VERAGSCWNRQGVCAGDAQTSAASRADYAEAAAAVLASADAHAGRTYELAGPSFTMTEYAAELSRLSGTQVDYVDLPEDTYRSALLDAGLREPVAAMLAQSDAAARGGALEGPTDDLEGLIGRPATPMPDVVAEALVARADG
jgi:NAD(P)H dehydrogenase (quinone)